jgi:hypothetical protein
MPSKFCASGHASVRCIPDGENVLRHRCFGGTCDEEALRPIQYVDVRHLVTYYAFCKQSSGRRFAAGQHNLLLLASTRPTRGIPADNTLVASSPDVFGAFTQIDCIM